MQVADRSLKNILVQAKGPAWWVKLADFGITKRLREPRETNPGFTTHLFGTPGYVAPEIIYPDFVPNVPKEAARDCKFAVDAWGVGIVIFQMIFNRLPFSSALHLSKYVLGVDQLPLKDYAASGLSTEGHDFVKNALSASPAERPSMDEAWAHEWIQSTRNVTSTTTRQPTVNAVVPPALVLAAQASTIAYRPKNQYQQDGATYSRQGTIVASPASLDQDPGKTSTASARWTSTLEITRPTAGKSEELASVQRHPTAVSPLTSPSTSHQPRGQGSHPLPTATAQGSSSSRGRPEMSSSQVRQSPEAATFPLRNIILQSRRCENLAISPNGRFIAFASLKYDPGLLDAQDYHSLEIYKEVEIWEITEREVMGRLVQQLYPDDPRRAPIDQEKTVLGPLTVAYSPDGSQLLVQHLAYVDVFDVRKSSGHAKFRNSLNFPANGGGPSRGQAAFTPDSKRIVVSLDTFTFGDNVTGEDVYVRYFAGTWHYLSEHERPLVSPVTVLDTSDLPCVSHDLWISDNNHFHLAGGHLLLGGVNGDRGKGIMHAWDISALDGLGSGLQRRPVMLTLGTHIVNSFTDMRFSPNGRYLLSRGYGTVQGRVFSEFSLWTTIIEGTGLRQLDSALLIPMVHDSNAGHSQDETGIAPSNYAISSDGRWCAVGPRGRWGDTDTTVGLYEVRTGALRGTIDLGKHKMTDWLDILQFSPDGRLLFTATPAKQGSNDRLDRDRLKVWDLRSLA